MQKRGKVHKLTEKDVQVIRLRLWVGVSSNQLAREFQVSRKTIHEIKCRKAWVHVSID